MKLSNCCDAPELGETDLCSECKEHADFYDDEEANDRRDDFRLSQQLDQGLEVEA